MFDYLRYLIHYIAVRLGLWDSPSLSAFGGDHRDYDAKVTKDGVCWKKKAIKKIESQIDEFKEQN